MNNGFTEYILRKSIDGLAVRVQEAFHWDPFAPALFVFGNRHRDIGNRHRDKLKILGVDRTWPRGWVVLGEFLFGREVGKGEPCL